MNFLNPEEQKRIAIRKAEPPAPPGSAPAAVPAAAAKPAAAKPGVAPGKAPATPTVVNAIVKQKPPPQVQVLQVEEGVFEVHFTCSCGEQYVIRCDSIVKPEKQA